MRGTMFVNFPFLIESELCGTVYQILQSKLSQWTVSREDWTDSGMIRKLNITEKLILKVQEVEVI